MRFWTNGRISFFLDSISLRTSLGAFLKGRGCSDSSCCFQLMEVHWRFIKRTSMCVYMSWKGVKGLLSPKT